MDLGSKNMGEKWEKRKLCLLKVSSWCGPLAQDADAILMQVRREPAEGSAAHKLLKPEGIPRLSIINRFFSQL
ncbi:Transmembrane O-Methyltransferase [Manis pentadactyla]|nr:Transmembrane O-Methyltransferase [Manis pentadactyla]